MTHAGHLFAVYNFCKPQSRKQAQRAVQLATLPFGLSEKRSVRDVFFWCVPMLHSNRHLPDIGHLS